MGGRIEDFVFWLTGEAVIPIYTLCVRSIRSKLPDARIYVYTDNRASLVHGDMMFVNDDYGTLPKMVANLRAQTDHVMSPFFCRPTAFLDADLLMQDFLYAPTQDVLITRRLHASLADEEADARLVRAMPYNYGVVLANPTAGARYFFASLLARVAEYGPQYQDWYGNQMALRELVGPPNPDSLSRTVQLKRFATSATVLIEDADWYNYTPRTEDEDVTDHGIVHYKGDRKPWMVKRAQALGL